MRITGSVIALERMEKPAESLKNQPVGASNELIQQTSVLPKLTR
jgi:hypothetical protein